MTGKNRPGGVALPMAAWQANRSHLPDVGLFRYFTLTHCGGAWNDWPSAFVTRI